MEYVYAAMVLHSAGKEVNEKNLSKVLKAAGIEIDEARVKSLTTALEGVDIDEAIKTASAPATQVAPTPAEAEKEEKPKEKEEKAEEEEEAEEVAGLGELFG
ncbi:50S ribosomal protein L12 [candidate division MSBL1 archaeon SCGC-AAA261F19]|uniref:Large ribosomal subunit protein P1 n=2 Tax=candidate division MSBL1 TaxID=215777 RepID=A0A133VAL2_9EURY|nr:50S ribosomal protein L12 [candidate division MSBL1 archaeon SCGC-AAA261D19]KXB03454.1 50S ribosomal protein L12 [candidate division MSBL1 archaeon SCGC-AAA261F19]